MKKPDARGFGATHFALSVATDAANVRRLRSRRAGNASTATAARST